MLGVLHTFWGFGIPFISVKRILFSPVMWAKFLDLFRISDQEGLKAPETPTPYRSGPHFGAYDWYRVLLSGYGVSRIISSCLAQIVSGSFSLVSLAALGMDFHLQLQARSSVLFEATGSKIFGSPNGDDKEPSAVI